jgi:hypothetical protein
MTATSGAREPRANEANSSVVSPAGSPILLRIGGGPDGTGRKAALCGNRIGHSKITTTERYLHARPLNELAEPMDTIFAVAPSIDEETVESPRH